MADDAGSGDAPCPPRTVHEPSAEPRAASPGRDLLLVGGPSEEGTGAEVLRIRDGRLETGELRPMKEGQPVVGEIVKLSSRPEHERLFDVEVLARGHAAQPPDGAAPGARSPARKGPAKVSTDAYRSGWDAIFGKPRDQLN